MKPADDAQTIKQLLIQLSPLIEEYTSLVCPGCTDVCCKQRRSVLDETDVRYIRTLGLPLPVHDSSRLPDGPCQFMGERGCITPRWQRPWRCTWYFCDPLLSALAADSQKKARRISSLIQSIVDIRSSWASGE